MSRPRSQLPTQEDLIESQARTLALARERRAEAERWEQAEAERRQDEAQAQAAIGPAEGLDMQNIRLICVAVVAALALAAIGTALGGGTLQYQRRLTTVRVAPEIPAPPEASRATAEERNWTRGLWAPSQPPSLAAATDRTPQHRKGHTQKRKKGLRRHKHASEELGLLRPPPPPPPLPSSEPPRRRKKRRRSQAQPPPAEPAQPAPEAQPQPQPQEQPQTPPPPRRRKRKRRPSSSSSSSSSSPPPPPLSPPPQRHSGKKRHRWRKRGAASAPPPPPLLARSPPPAGTHRSRRWKSTSKQPCKPWCAGPFNVSWHRRCNWRYCGGCEPCLHLPSEGEPARQLAESGLHLVTTAPLLPACGASRGASRRSYATQSVA